MFDALSGSNTAWRDCSPSRSDAATSDLFVSSIEAGLRQALGRQWKLTVASEGSLPSLGTGQSSDGFLTIFSDDRNPGSFILRFGQLAGFDISILSQQICIVSTKDISSSTLHHLLFDQVLPRILAHEGQLVLHSAGVEMGLGTVLFVGPSGCGKSTLAASLHVSGSRLLGDDAFLISTQGERWMCRPVYPSLRMFQDSVAGVFGGSADLSRVADYSDKWKVGGLTEQTASKPIAIRVVFLLDPDPVSEIRVEHAEGAAACMALVGQSFSIDPTNLATAKQRLAQASALVGAVPTLRLCYPRDFAMLPAVGEAILEQLSDAGS